MVGSAHGLICMENVMCGDCSRQATCIAFKPQVGLPIIVIEGLVEVTHTLNYIDNETFVVL